MEDPSADAAAVSNEPSLIDTGPPSESPDNSDIRQELGRGQRDRIPNRKYFNEDFVNVCTSSRGFLTMRQAEDRLKMKITAGASDRHFINSLTWGHSVAELVGMCTSQHDAALMKEMEYYED